MSGRTVFPTAETVPREEAVMLLLPSVVEAVTVAVIRVPRSALTKVYTGEFAPKIATPDLFH
jgi:hypothetical protein